MRISRVALVPVIAAFGVAGAILAAPAMTAPTTHAAQAVYVHSSQIVGHPGVYVHS